jgi:hypothetical protein
MNKGTWNKELGCDLVSVNAIGDDSVRIVLAEGHACDMTGAINLAKKTLADVSHIITMSGAVPDTSYVKNGTGEWGAHQPKR